MRMFKDDWIIRPLLKKGMATQEIIDEIKRAGHDGVQEYLSEKIVALGYLSQSDMGHLLENMFQIPYVNLDEININKEVTKVIPEEICRKYLIFPYQINKEYITIAIFDPMNLEAEKEISYISSRLVQTTLSSKHQILEKINEYFSPDRYIEGLSSKLTVGTEESPEGHEDEVRAQKIDSNKGDAPIVRLVNSILNDAIEKEASDIHIEPTEKKILIRFRIDGILKIIMEVPKYAAPPLTSRIKIISNLDIAETRKPQDGQAKVKKAGASIDLRVSVLPTSYGEKIVIRILDSRKGSVSFEQLGIIGENLQKLNTVLGMKQGIILVTGPTGSGKTTTLYSALNRIKSSKTNILTVEDPIEYSMDDINQVQVNVKAGVTFASALRSFLRQDPDVILVGEIRDRETAEISIQASLTGHLVLSTLHTNSAIETITRLIDIGIDKFKVSSALSAIIGQRLVRCACSSCKEEKEPDFAEKALIPLIKKMNLPVKFYKGKGCPICDFSGYKGRRGIYEILIMDKETRSKVEQGASIREIEITAGKYGFKNFTKTAIEYITSGVTDVAEISRVITIDTSINTDPPASSQPVSSHSPAAAQPASDISSQREFPIPLQAQAPPVQDAHNDGFITEEDLNPIFTGFAAAPDPVPVNTTPQAPIFSKPVTQIKTQRPSEMKKILVVEDDTIMRTLIVKILEKEGIFNITDASNGQAALEYIKVDKPDLIILDVLMPIMGGLEVCKHVRRSKEHATIPIIMLTALGEKEDLLKGFEAGADDYLSKPIDRQILLARVHAIFRRIEIDTNEIVL